ncbi:MULTISPECIES: hypothetical protein [unclassified Moorena]|nr:MULTISPECIES: hypothetical protein [unclassified Moorena]
MSPLHPLSYRKPNRLGRTTLALAFGPRYANGHATRTTLNP